MRKNPVITLQGLGMTGLFAAIAFMKAGCRVYTDAYLKKKETRLSEEADTRVSALTPVSVHFLKKWGIWPFISLAQKTPFYQIKVWDSSGSLDSALLFKGHTLGGDASQKTDTPLGYIVENSALYAALVQCFETLQAEQKDIDHFLNLKSNLTFRANTDLMIIADGAQSPWRKKLGIGCQVKHYHQAALTFVITTDCPHQNTAYQRFLKGGPLACLPLGDPCRYAIVWSVPDSEAKKLLGMPDERLAEAFQEALGDHRLGRVFRLVSPRMAFGLTMQHADQYVQKGIVLIGDAAHTVHPLAGYGLNMGFLDVITLLNILQEKNESFLLRPVSHLATLRRYERLRRTENGLMLKAIDAFTRPVFRKAGFYITRRIPDLQHFFAYFMASYGLQNDLSSFNS